jgi:hypothetical protein
MRRPALLTLLVAASACGTGAASAPPAPVRSAEELLAPYVKLHLGDGVDALRATRPTLEPGYASGTKAELIDTHDPSGAVVSFETEAGRVRAVVLEWHADAAYDAERDVRRRLPAPRECATLAGVEDFKSLLWRLPDGASATAMRKGKTWRLTVSRPPADGFDSYYESCAAAP